MPSSDMLVQQSSKLPDVLKRIPARKDIKVTHHPAQSMGLEHWRVTWGRLDWLSCALLSSVSALVFILMSVVFSGGCLQMSCIILLMILLPATYSAMGAVYKDRRHMICYHDGFAILTGRVWLKPPVQEEHLWRDVRRIEIRYVDAAMRRRSQELHSRVQELSAARDRSNARSVDSSTPKIDAELWEAQRQLQALQADIKQRIPTLDLETLRHATHEGDDVACYDSQVVLDVHSEHLPLLTRPQALTLYNVVGGMIGVVQDESPLNEDVQDEHVPLPVDDW